MIVDFLKKLAHLQRHRIAFSVIIFTKDDGKALAIRISTGFAQVNEDSLIKDVLAEVESKNNQYYEIELK